MNSINWNRPQLTKKLLLVSAAVILLIITAYPIGSSGITNSQSAISVAIHRVSPAATSSPAPVVYVNPFSIPFQGLGSVFTVQVKVENMAQFNGWDIQIVNQVPQIINATGLSISGNIFAINTTGGSPFEIVHCVNGAGTGCISTDGPGVVHSAFGDTAFTGGNGLLFTITYQIIGNSPYGFITYGNSLISSSSPSGVAHFSQNGVYGTAPSSYGGGGAKSLAT